MILKIKTIMTIILNILIIVLLLCFGCMENQPPLEFAPNPKIIEKAIIFKLKYQYQSLSEQLYSNIPLWQIKKINVNKIEPNFIFNMPTYHLEGTYQLNIQQKRKKNYNIENTFNLDLQRQSQGKTWRILIKTKDSKGKKYFSYQI